MKVIIVFLFIPFGIDKNSFAQDTLSISKNQIYLEALGSGFSSTPISICYSRKIASKSVSCVTFGGFGIPWKQKDVNNASFTCYSFCAGAAFRGQYKRNGFWGSISVSLALGKWDYLSGYTHASNGSLVSVYYHHETSFQITPQCVYQFQSKSERFFCRFTLGVKMYPGFFLNSYRDINSEGIGLFPWLGLSSGLGW